MAWTGRANVAGAAGSPLGRLVVARRRFAACACVGDQASAIAVAAVELVGQLGRSLVDAAVGDAAQGSGIVGQPLRQREFAFALNFALGFPGDDGTALTPRPDAGDKAQREFALAFGADLDDACLQCPALRVGGCRGTGFEAQAVAQLLARAARGRGWPSTRRRAPASSPAWPREIRCARRRRPPRWRHRPRSSPAGRWRDRSR